jgi:hypothetical protein
MPARKGIENDSFMSLITLGCLWHTAKTTEVVAIVKPVDAVHLNVSPAFGPFSLFLPQ